MRRHLLLAAVAGAAAVAVSTHAVVPHINGTVSVPLGLSVGVGLRLGPDDDSYRPVVEVDAGLGGARISWAWTRSASGLAPGCEPPCCGHGSSPWSPRRIRRCWGSNCSDRIGTLSSTPACTVASRVTATMSSGAPDSGGGSDKREPGGLAKAKSGHSRPDCLSSGAETSS